MMNTVMGESNQQYPASGQHANATSPSDHRRLTDAGWSYRMTDDRDFILYRDYSKGAGWHTQKDALAILDGRPVETSKR
jgi:hypothetical protein